MTSTCGKIKCPICKGTGKVHEDRDMYNYETRDPRTDRCLICNGSGLIHARKKLPDGQRVSELRNQNTETAQLEDAYIEKTKKAKARRLASLRPIYIIVVQRSGDVASIIQGIEGGENA